MGKNTKYINGYEREHPNDGIMRKIGEQVNALPEVGTKVIVERYKIRAKNAIVPNQEEEGYRLHEDYLDMYKRPRVYTVESYTKGIDTPFDVKNSVLLKARLGGENWITQTIKTVDIACGYLRLTPAPDEEKVVCND